MGLSSVPHSDASVNKVKPRTKSEANVKERNDMPTSPMTKSSSFDGAVEGMVSCQAPFLLIFGRG